MKRRERTIETVKCPYPDCPRTSDLDRDLLERVTTIPVLKEASARGAFVAPLLRFPIEFYHYCEEHRKERFGYRDIYDALAYLIVVSDPAYSKGLAVSWRSLRQAGLDGLDLSEVRKRIKRWRP